MSRSSIFRRLVWQVVEHACAHYETRLTVLSADPMVAGNPCTQCDAQGRPPRPSFDERELAQSACDARNLKEDR